jgi:probable phosphoglycerate mutase
MRLLYLARHGETDWNVAGRWQGQSDIPLNDNGRAQARVLGEALRPVDISAIVSSDLSRARETARIAGDLLGLGIAYVDAGLRERTFGIFEGLTREECERLHPEAWRAWVEDLTPPLGGESREVLAARVIAAIGRAAEGAGHGGAPVLVVTHGGALRTAVGVATGNTPAPVANGGIWKIDWDGGIVAASAL